jgi:uncharacterized membrane protein YczE
VLVAGWLLRGAVGAGTVVTGLLIGPAIAFWLGVVGARTPEPSLAPSPAEGSS